MKILIVDDNVQNIYLMEAMLKSEAHKIITASNGAEALGLAKNDPPDLIISDILMPVMDGYTLCTHWQKDEILRDIPFVFYTATYTDPKDEEFGLSLGASKFVLKPQEPDEFLKIVNEVLKDVKSKKLKPGKKGDNDEVAVLKEYNETLIRKLEDKMLDAERAYNKLEVYAKDLENEISEKNLAQKKVEAQLHELQRWYDATLGREERIIELKREVNELLIKAKKPPKYEIK